MCQDPAVATIVEQSVEIAAPVDEVFAYVDDFSTTRDWMYGLHKIEPVTEQLRGVGAEYDGVMKVGVSLTSRIRCTGWELDRLIELTSVKGIRNTQRWTFSALDGDRTRVDAWISYTLPGGPAGAAMAAAMKPFVGIAIKHTSETLVRMVESRRGA
ncbi:SRPBCC family protein [Nocardioides marmoriginsengisoli]|uniref:SRPBCC family protein n=1 Tax=Nocardioides marmoriginsengisoli TaxID=661483 RepID=A0A3N0CGL4_9ACTN|nr:SRPBCC family protein [Nocardioides marmoriginsengisoli]